MFYINNYQFKNIYIFKKKGKFNVTKTFHLNSHHN